MSTATTFAYNEGLKPGSGKHYFVYCPDYTDSEALSRRMAVRPEHLASWQPLNENGWTKLSGPFFTPESIEPGATDKKFVGSMFIIEAESVEAIRKRIEADAYWKGNVWDKEKFSITAWGGPTTMWPRA
ncbi:hypothetical protein DL93DRAFT_2087768 [Clavulina sp. PMI_390]|nr:hypothetical protein DL93DRAFT_2087768 [Clavulina sp. PMI_390]